MFFQRIKTPGIAHSAYILGEGGEAVVVDPRRDVDDYLRLARENKLTIDQLASVGKRLLGFATGLAFGALLQRGRLSRHDVILSQLLLRDGYIVKTMATAVAVGAVGLHQLERRGITAKDVKPMKVGGVTLGAVLFGTGLAVAGYCPGTSLAAFRRGSTRRARDCPRHARRGRSLRLPVPAPGSAHRRRGDLGKRTLSSLTETAAAQ
jgi:hypothetical protein